MDMILDVVNKGLGTSEVDFPICRARMAVW